MVKEKTPKKSEKELINMLLLKDICIDIIKLFENYNLNPVEMKFVLSELKNIVGRLVSKKEEMAFKLTDMLMKQLKEQTEKDL